MQYRINSEKVDFYRKNKAESYWRGFFARVTKHFVFQIIRDNSGERYSMKIKIKCLPNT